MYNFHEKNTDEMGQMGVVYTSHQNMLGLPLGDFVNTLSYAMIMATASAARASADRDGAVRLVSAGTTLVFQPAKIRIFAVVMASASVENAFVIHRVFTRVNFAKMLIAR